MARLWRLTVRSDFAAAHALRHYQGKCEALHGHNFFVEATVQGSKLTGDTELLMDFKEIKSLLKTVLDKLDHKDLNQIPEFSSRNPSSENLAAFIYAELAGLLSAYPDVRLHSVTVSEKSAQSATYLEFDGPGEGAE
ncbi:6-carboxytetrahydropterin synthase QueD [Desulfovibrio sp. OttesenSCG-928-C14]|nr:6-carboxytetrahydropterin synthase QueD [Desulfovibrio sp. OttesenSCG-928-C14]